MDWIDFVSRFVHIFAAITLAGGLFYIRAVQLPSFETADSELGEKLRRRWARLVMISTMWLILSGIYNYIATINGAKAGEFELARFYHPVVGIKILLALVVFFLASILSGRTSAARRFQEKICRWMSVAVFAVIVIIALASALKVGGKLPRDGADTPPSTVEIHG